MKSLFSRAPLFLLIICCIVGCKEGPHVEWKAYDENLIKQAAESHRPVIIYFAAAWCGPCHALKDYTFTDPGVINALEGFERLKADMSFSHSVKVQELDNRYRVSGLPTVVLLDPNGKEAVEFRMRGFVHPPNFLKTIQLFKALYQIKDYIAQPKILESKDPENVP